MLKGISPLFSPELLATLYRMGHGDEIVLADAHFPGDTMNDLVIRADGLKIADLLDAILPLFVLDEYVDDPVAMMACVPGDEPDPAVEADYQAAIDRHAPDAPAITFVAHCSIFRVENVYLPGLIYRGRGKSLIFPDFVLCCADSWSNQALCARNARLVCVDQSPAVGCLTGVFRRKGSCRR